MIEPSKDPGSQKGKPVFLNRNMLADQLETSIGTVERRMAAGELEPDAFAGRHPLFDASRLPEIERIVNRADE